MVLPLSKSKLASSLKHDIIDYQSKNSLMRFSHLLPLALTLMSINLASGSPKLAYPIVDTAQSECYDLRGQISPPSKGKAFYGQDAQHRGKQPSYTDLGNGCVRDNVTGLIWEKSYRVMGLTDALKAAAQCQTGGYQDWRLPTIKEVYSLALFNGVDASSPRMSQVPAVAKAFIDRKYFDFAYGACGSRPIDSAMLSSTVYTGLTLGNQKTVFGFNFADGHIKGYPIYHHGSDKTFVVRFVRGAAYGNNDFVDHKNGTITDRATGLMWTKLDSKRGMDWPSALAYVQKMNSQKLFGYSDWRLPNAKELHSIVDYSRSLQSTQSASIHPIFKCTQIERETGTMDYPYYWTSTTHLEPNLRGPGISSQTAIYIAFGEAPGKIFGMAPGKNQGKWIDSPTDIHGAGSQRCANKQESVAGESQDNTPQGNSARINNFIRLVR